MKSPIPSEVLRYARDRAEIRQSALAKALDTNATFVSRLEKGGAVDPAFAQRYLRALETPLAREIIEFYEREWLKVDAPSFLHPDREELWHIEQTLRQIDLFESSPQNHPILTPTIASLRDDLSSVFRYLERLDHVIAWVGDIGVGKTTALAHAARLTTVDGKGLTRSVFPVGPGRTTVCETIIKVATAVGVAVEPLDENSIRTLLRDMISGVAGGKSNVPAEMAKVLRNMSGYTVKRVPVGNDFETHDPISEALRQGITEELLVDQIVAAMNLSSRRETSVASTDNDDVMVWLSKTISKINSGLDPRFSVPRRITVLVPSDTLKSGSELSIVDTKGVEGVTQRPDLNGYIDDPRTLVVLCTKFPDAPNATVQRILQENEDLGSDSATRHRFIMLVLPRNNEPLEIENGDAPTSRKEGCAIRRDEIKNALKAADLPVIGIDFYDAHLDSPETVWSSLRSQISLMRSVYVDRLNRSVRAVAELISDVDLVKTRGAVREIQQEFERLTDRIEALPPVRRPAHQNLIDQFDAGHQSSVAASMVRRGEWPNFSILHILGVGVRHDANLRSSDHFSRIEHAIEDIEHRFGELADVRAMMGSLRDRLTTWRQDFLTQALSIGSDAFKPTLSDEAALQLWANSGARYGTGVPGYKRELAAMWQNFFESSAPDEAREAIEVRLTKAWTSTIIFPLLAATGAGRLSST